MFRHALIAAIAVAALAGQASATVHTINFEIDPTANPPFSAWIQGLGNTNPYGLPSQPHLAGSFTVDDSHLTDFEDVIEGVFAKAKPPYILSFDLVAGTKTFSLADVGADSYVGFTNGIITGFDITLGPQSRISQGGATLIDGTAGLTCSNLCVSFADASAAIPEPSTWALAITGFAAAGATIRRRRATGARA
jgi:hypothetical protein